VFLHSRPMSVGPTVLIVRFSALGDVILTTPVIRAIRTAHPEATVTFVTKGPYRELLEAQSTIDRVVALEGGESARSLVRRIGASFDYALDLQGSLRSRAVRFLIKADWTLSSKPRLDRLRSIWLGQDVESQHMVNRHLEAAREIVGSTPATRPILETPPEGPPAPRGLDTRIALAPGASHRSKRWDRSSWFDLAKSLNEAGWSPIMVGLEADQRNFIGIQADSAWHLSLTETVELLANCRGVIALDSGLMHAAGAVGTPVVAMFGPTSPDLGFAPMGSGHQVVVPKISCHPCSGFGGSDCPAGHHRCLTGIMPATVQAALEQVV
jgi:heptosyltransferase-2